MTWHPAFVGRALTPDHAHAATHLYQAFLDGLTSHVSTVASFESGRPHAAWLSALEAAQQRDLPPPPTEPADEVVRICRVAFPVAHGPVARWPLLRRGQPSRGRRFDP